MTSVVHFYPNGEFTAGQDTSRKRSRSRHEQACDSLHMGDQSPVAKNAKRENVISTMPHSVPVGATLQSPSGTLFLYVERLYQGGIVLSGYNTRGEFIEIRDNRNIKVFMRQEGYTLVHQTVEFSQNDKPGRKVCPQMTRSMGRNIRNAAYILEQDYGKDKLSFLTLTLPDLCPDNLQKCHENWGRMVDQFLKWLKSRIESHDGEFLYTYCSEVQPKRLRDRGEYALHLHLLFVGRGMRKGGWYVTPIQCRKAWTRCIKNVVSEPFKSTALENLQRIRRSAGAYLSKYMSKGKSGYSAAGLPESAKLVPIHWGGMARALSREIRKRSCTYRGDGPFPSIANSLTRNIHSSSKHPAIKYVKTSFIEFPNKDGTKGLRGIWVASGCLRKGLHTSILADMIADLLGVQT